MPLRHTLTTTLALVLLLVGGASTPASAAPFTYLVTMSGAQVVPPALNGPSAFGQVIYDADDNSLQFAIVLITGSPANVVAAELRQGPIGSNGALVQQLAGSGWNQISGRVVISADTAANLKAGQLYLEIRGPSGPASRGQIFPPGVPGILPTPALPTVAPAPASQSGPAQPSPAAAPAGNAGAAPAGAIRPPATGSGGLRGR